MKLSKIIKSDLFILSLVFFGLSFIFYGYFWLFIPGKLQLLFQNWDGPNYVVIARSFYDQNIINQVNTVSLPGTYFAAHFPLYPVLIRLFSFIGFFRSMVFVSLISSWLFLVALYFLVTQLKITPKPLWFVLPFIIFPARWFVVSHVGSSEPVFLLFLTLFLLYFYKQKYLLSALFAALAQLTRAQGIIIFAGIMSYYLYIFISRKTKLTKNLFLKQILPYFLIPIALISVFTLYYFQYHDFFAFFNTIAQYRHLQFPPFQVFEKIRLNTSVNVWKEVYIYNYLLYLLPAFFLVKKKLFFPFFIYLFFLLPLPFLVHEDISRYALPLLPFLALGLSQFITHLYFRISLLIVLPAIFAYAINYTLFNLSP